MTSTDYLYRLLFKLRIHEAFGDQFQILFNDVMYATDPRFRCIAPWGSWGDGGNDGWIEEDGHYYQVYGPRPTTRKEDAETTALAKAIDDFDKLPEKWQNIRRFTFVMNDHFHGIPGPIESALQTLKTKKQLEHAGGFSTKELLSRFMTLGDDQRQEIIGYVPTEGLEFIDASAMGELLTTLTRISHTKLTFLHETVPDFELKIKFNGLTPQVGSRLQSNSYQVSTVDDFLLSTDPGLKQAIAQEMRSYYQDAKLAILEGTDDAADLRYFWMVEKLISHAPSEHAHTVAAYRSAAEIIIAKYFETCDAYEHPNGSTTS